MRRSASATLIILSSFLLTSVSVGEEVAGHTTLTPNALTPVGGPTLPAGWQLVDQSSIGGAPTGIQVVSSALGADGASLHFSGVAQASGNVDVRFVGSSAKVGPAVTVEASLEVSDVQITLGSSAPRFYLRAVARNSDGRYIGELFPQKLIDVSAGAHKVSASATTPPGTANVRPYFRAYFKAGKKVDYTIQIMSPAIYVPG